MSFDLGARPGAGEYGDFHAGYIAAVPLGDIRETLARETAAAGAFYGAITGEQANFAYAPGKWTIREVLAHIADGERVFAYRALRFGRGDRDAAARLRPGSVGAREPCRHPALAGVAGGLRGGPDGDAPPLPVVLAVGLGAPRRGERHRGLGAGASPGSSPATSCTTGGSSSSATASARPEPSGRSARTRRRSRRSLR